MSIYCFIFARGGSKGLPGKNIKQLAGKPLIAHSIDLAKEIEAIDKIYVSTDCLEIAAVAEIYGAEVIMRPAYLATDTASEWLAWQHAISFLSNRGEGFEVFLSLPATSPLRAKEDVMNCLAGLEPEVDVVLAVSPAYRNPYFNMLLRDPLSGLSQVVIKDSAISRRQDAPEVFDITTVAYVARPEFILNSSGLFSGVVKSVIVPRERSIDIDDSFDFMMAEALYGIPCNE